MGTASTQTRRRKTMVPRNIDESSLAELLEQKLQGRTPEHSGRSDLGKYNDVTGSEAALMRKTLALVQSRRQFIITSAVAAAGLFIKPLGVSEAQGGFWQSLSGFFKTFGTSILFSFLTQGGPGSIPGFGNLAQGFLPLLLLFSGGVFG